MRKYGERGARVQATAPSALLSSFREWAAAQGDRSKRPKAVSFLLTPDPDSASLASKDFVQEVEKMLCNMEKATQASGSALTVDDLRILEKLIVLMFVPPVDSLPAFLGLLLHKLSTFILDSCCLFTGLRRSEEDAGGTTDPGNISHAVFRMLVSIFVPELLVCVLTCVSIHLLDLRHPMLCLLFANDDISSYIS